MSRRPEPQTRKVRIAAVPPPRTRVLPDELLQKLRGGAAAPSPTARLPETIPLAAREPARVEPPAPPAQAPALGLALPRTRLVLAAGTAALTCGLLLALAPQERKAAPSAAGKPQAHSRTAAAGAPTDASTPPIVSRAAPEPRPTARVPQRAAPVPSARAVAQRPAPSRVAARDARALAELTETAIDQLARGDDRAALASYRTLAALVPTQRAYALVAEVLEHRLDARCHRSATGGEACAR